MATGNVLANDGAGTGDVLTVTGWSGGALGTPMAIADLQNASIMMNASGAFTIDASAADALAAGESVSRTFTYDMLRTNVAGTSTHAVSLTITITGTNDAPVITGETFTAQVEELGGNVDTGSISTSGTLTFDDADLTDAHSLAFAAVGTTLGTLSALSIVDGATGAGDGTISWTYTVDAADVAYLAAGETRVEEFTVTVWDDDGAPLSDSATVRVAITGGNDGPVALADLAAAAEDTSVILLASDLLANDGDVDGDVLTIVSVQNAVGGSVTLDAQGNVVFTPAPDFNGPASFTYTVRDAWGATATTEVAVTVAPVNDAPQFAVPAVNVTTLEDTAVSGQAIATDVDGDAQTYALGATVPTRGSVTVNGNGSWVYTPSGNANGADSFTIIASDGHGGAAPITVNLTITPVNDAPVAAADSGFATTGDVLLAITAAALLANDRDVDGDTLTIQSVQASLGGTAVINARGDVSFTPIEGYIGPASFQYTMTDGAGGSSTANVTLTVNPTPGTILGTTGANSITGTTGNDVINALDGNDTVNGAAGIDTLYGGLGNDTLNGGAGADSYVYRSGDGSDFIDESSRSTAEVDVLRFVGLNASDLTFSHRTGGNDLLIKINATGVTIEVDEQFFSTLTAFGVEQIQFADGSTWNLARIIAEAHYRGTAANETLVGSDFGDTIDGDGGADTLTGGVGADIFVFGAGDGKDVITDLAIASDKIKLSLGTQFDSFAEVSAAAAQVGANTVITFDADTSLTLQNIQTTALIVDHFIFAA